VAYYVGRAGLGVLGRARDVLARSFMPSAASVARKLRRCLAFVALTCAPHAIAQSPSVALGVSATDPEPQATLQRSETFYVRVGYQSDRPLRIRIQGLHQGKRVPTMTNPSPRSDPPSGEALVWLASDRPAAIDEIQVSAEDQTTGKVVAQASLPVNLEWTGSPAATPRQVAEWARTMSQAQQQVISEDMRGYGQSGGFMDTLLGLVMMLSVPGYIAAQVWSLKRLEGGWRKAAWVPAFVMGAALVFSLFALSRSSNLWPIWLILLAPLALIWLAVLMLLNRSMASA
jgi:hypothetical protein